MLSLLLKGISAVELKGSGLLTSEVILFGISHMISIYCLMNIITCRDPAGFQCMLHCMWGGDCGWQSADDSGG